MVVSVEVLPYRTAEDALSDVSSCYGKTTASFGRTSGMTRI